MLWLGSSFKVMVRVWSLFDVTAAFSLWIHLSQKDKLPTTSRSVQLEAEAKTRDFRPRGSSKSRTLLKDPIPAFYREAHVVDARYDVHQQQRYAGHRV